MSMVLSHIYVINNKWLGHPTTTTWQQQTWIIIAKKLLMLIYHLERQIQSNGLGFKNIFK